MLLLIVLLPLFLGTAATLWLGSRSRWLTALTAGAVTAASLGLLLGHAPAVMAGEVILNAWDWVPEIGLNLTFRLDGLSMMFAGLILFIGLMIVIYAHYYLSPKDSAGKFYSEMMLFMAAMLGVVLSDNLLLLVVFWELTSLSSFLLVGYWSHRADARAGARQALAVTGGGGLAMLGGFVLLGQIAGTYELSAMLGKVAAIQADPMFVPALLLILIGAFTKSAQFPFHFWLPDAMAAPTPVSAYLHSATMVKAGVFLMARMWPVLGGTEQWFWLVGGAGVCTLLLGAYVAMFQDDLKGLLAYSTISHLGLITLLLGLNSPLAAVAAVFHIMNHATFKASLFMAAGIIDHESGSRDIRKLSGLFRMMPITATLAMVASASMAGVPLLNGFLSKEMFFAETVYISANTAIEYGLPIAATIAGIFSVAYSLRFTVDVFFGPPATDLPHTPHEPPHWMRVPVELLVLTCLVVGMLPALSVGRFLDAAARPVVGGQLPKFSLAVWHGFNLPLVMSFVALAGGVALYMLLRAARQRGHLERPPGIQYLNGKRAFEITIATFSLWGRAGRRMLGTRRLQVQLLWLISTALVVGMLPLWALGLQPGDRPSLPPSPVFILLWVIGAICAVGAAWQAKYHRLAALALLSGAGLATCITFTWFSAPDLALTQLSVEAVTTVLILLGLRWLPRRLEPAEMGVKRTRLAVARRMRDFAIAAAAGTGMAAIAWAMMTRPFPQSISTFFLERAQPEGGGTNVVNVMLVDFRGFDTMGEIVVLGIVALTVYALLRRFRPARETLDLPVQQRALPADLETDLVNPRLANDTAVGYLMVPAVLMRLVLPLACMVSVYLFMRGHNEPGGGFVAGLVMSVALLLQYIVSGTVWVEENMPLHPRRWIGLGILIALATGVGSWFFGYPFMTTHTAHFTLPLIGEIHVASALFFDIGVFTLVVGATLLVLTSLAHQSVRSHRFHARMAEDENNDNDAAPAGGAR